MQGIVGYLSGRRDEYLSDLERLVNVDCGTTNKAGVDAVGRAARAILEREGFRVHVLPVADYGDCLVGRMQGTGEARVLLVGHLDTVFPDGTVAARPMTVRDGCILGPGTSDMKAGLLSGVYAAAALRSIGFADFAEIAFFCNSEEEVGSPVSRELYADIAAGADAALVLESARADGAIVSGRKGGAHYYVRIHGHAAHSGVEPEKGASAVHEAARQVLALQALNGIRPGVTVNVCLIHGGVRSNVIPDLAEAEVDARVVLPDDMNVVDLAVRDIVERTEVAGTTSELWGGFGAFPMSKTPAVEYLVTLARGVARKLSIDLVDVLTGGVSDGNKIAQLGTPVLDGLGPIGGLDHSPDEYVVLESVVPRTALLAGLIREICRHREELRGVA